MITSFQDTYVFTKPTVFITLYKIYAISYYFNIAVFYKLYLQKISRCNKQLIKNTHVLYANLYYLNRLLFKFFLLNHTVRYISASPFQFCNKLKN